MLDKLQQFFSLTPSCDDRGFYSFVITGVDGDYEIHTDTMKQAPNKIILQFSEENDLKLTWEQNEREIMDIQSIPIGDVVAVEDGFEKSVQFVFKRMSSRMIKLNLYPELSLQMGIYWEICEDCD